MTAFLAVAAVMMAGALLAVLPPLLARREAETSNRGAANIVLLRRALEDNDADLRAGTIDRGQWETARREIERRAVEESQATDGAQPAAAAAERSPRIALLLAIVLPVAAVALYIVIGEPRAVSGKPPVPQQDATHAAENEQIQAMAEGLASKLKSAPEDPERWAILGRTYAYLGRLQEAMNAFEESMKRRPDDPRVLADYADMYAATKTGGNLMGEPEKLIKRALALDPNQPKALALAGTIAFQRKDFAGAVIHWQRAVSVLPPDSDFTKQIAAGLAEARAALGLPAGASPPLASAAAGTAPAKPAPGGASVSGTVTIAPGLASRASPDDTLFVFARAPEGAGPPLAVVRAKVRELPLKFRLDDSMAMSPENTLSRATRAVITTRVTKSRGVVPQPGDLEGASQPIAPGASGVAVLIDKAR